MPCRHGPLYRICFLSREPLNKALAVATERKSVPGCFKNSLFKPKNAGQTTMIFPPLNPLGLPYFPTPVVVWGRFKTIFDNDPSSYSRFGSRTVEKSHVQKVGIGWTGPFVSPFKGSAECPQKKGKL
ncbi:hypothetical protein JTE90_026871 [Oedothorax gibbosus]|uniref:Uncharacterized protein n=1 Tax=Oedothorax gibbosus TaxID=931172 RepID=A0AAV6TCP3_9ARAC|nr:hypothetical protein JTE90_026871 [Oedothorax gibbosus]